MGALQDKTVVVVGRGSGIARAVALLARSEGARVIVAGRDEAARSLRECDRALIRIPAHTRRRSPA